MVKLILNQISKSLKQDEEKNQRTLIVKIEKSSLFDPNDSKLNGQNNGIKYTRVKPGIFQTNFNWIKHLKFKGNKFLILENRVFQGLSHLTNLDLSNNLIREIKPNAFKGLDNQHELNLGKNFLSILFYFPMKLTR